MKTPNKSLVILAMSLSLLSCKKEIMIDVDEKASSIVIEAEISTMKAKNTVKITRTLGIREKTGFPAVVNATVTLSDHQGYSETLKEERPGEYSSEHFAGIPGRTYHLSVDTKTKHYEAQSTLAEEVILLSARLSKAYIGNTEMHGFIPVYKDPAGRRNYYRFVQFINGERLKGSVLRSDEFSDGILHMEPIYTPGLEISQDDLYEVEMQTIDDNAFGYFDSSERASSMNSAAPANPRTNISGGALGYFAVVNATKTTVSRR